ncbi:LysM peptidoglycan-binding domain-containing protein [Paenarthrobacter nicotinovorans]|uniref:LysM peptidoglycan-binding domain-containing protein n=1 Tax=Paenarthrobacter nicotinovorans TaxID=29320 RepID=UPI0005519B1F|nr:LysM domain-containing protein [Paenarthrobacter nicotinovorans]
MKFRFKAALVAVVLSTGLVACTSQDAPTDLNPPMPAEASPTDSAADAPTAAASAPTASSADDAPAALGDTVADSFGNALFYTTVDGDTLTNVAASFGLSSAKLAGFNGVEADTPLGPGTKLRLIPGPGPITVVDLSSANRPLTGTAGSWYEVVDRPNGVLAPGQTVSLALNKPINR